MSLYFELLYKQASYFQLRFPFLLRSSVVCKCLGIPWPKTQEVKKTRIWLAQIAVNLGWQKSPILGNFIFDPTPCDRISKSLQGMFYDTKSDTNTHSHAPFGEKSLALDFLTVRISSLMILWIWRITVESLAGTKHKL